MIKEVQEYKASNIKLINELKALEKTFYQTQQINKQEKEKITADFKAYTERLLSSYVAQQKKIKSLRDQIELL